MDKASAGALLKRVYRIWTWVGLAVGVVTIVLVLHKAPPPQVTIDPTAAARVQQKFAAADEARSQGQPAQVQLDSTELNSYLAQNLGLAGSPPEIASTAPVDRAASGAAPRMAAAGTIPATDAAIPAQDPSLGAPQSSVRGVKFELDDDVIRTYVVFELHGEDLSLELDGHLGTENGYIKFDPVAGKLGSLPLPQAALNAAVDRLMSSPENREKLRLPDEISSVEIQDGAVVLSYK